MKIILYEYVSGGGFAEQAIPTGILAEGFAMLRCIATDFKAAGHELTILLDQRIARLNPPIEASNILPIIYSDEPKNFLLKLAKKNEAIYLVAPETDQKLQQLVELTQNTELISLNSTPQAIAQVSNKTELYETLQSNGFSVPKTLTLDRTSRLQDIKQAIERDLTYPVIIKPADGAGCSGISLIKDETEIESALAKIETESENKLFLAQDFIYGESVSVSLLSSRKKVLVLSLNKQAINIETLKESSSYDGGCLPFEHPSKQKAYNIAQRVVETFSGLLGYVGVDLILSKDKIFVIDVNPRLTTSYTGLRQVADFNIAQAAVDAIVKEELPKKIQTRGVACFSKLQTHIPTVKAYQKAAKKALISPPFPLAGNIKAHSMLLGYGVNMEEANMHLEEAKKELLNIIS